jgi:hypothetical protein
MRGCNGVGVGVGEEVGVGEGVLVAVGVTVGGSVGSGVGVSVGVGVLGALTTAADSGVSVGSGREVGVNSTGCAPHAVMINSAGIHLTMAGSLSNGLIIDFGIACLASHDDVINRYNLF